MLVTTDHGHVDEGGHGGTSEQERTVFVIANRLGADLGGRSLGEARLVDVAPTALAALGIAVRPRLGPGRRAAGPSEPTMYHQVLNSLPEA